MDRREWLKLSAATAGATVGSRWGAAQYPARGAAKDSMSAKMNTPYENPISKGPFEDLPAELRLWDFQPRSIFKVPVTNIEKAKYPVIDLHQHGAHTGPDPAVVIQNMVKTMDAVGVERSVIFTGTGNPQKFTEISKLYSAHPGRFNLWCSFDLTGLNESGFGPNALKALEQCRRLGAQGVGEITDKGFGIGSELSGSSIVPGAHPDDPRLAALWDKVGQLGMPISIHMSDPIWVYQPMDNHNDWLPAAWTWRIPQTSGLLDQDGLIESLERTVQNHPKTIFSACHLIQQDYNLARLGEILDRHPNLYADLSARVQEISTIPRFSSAFIVKYQDRIVYGTDIDYNDEALRCEFRTLETLDEHFYIVYPGYNHSFWPMNGLGLADPVLKKLYRDNALQIYQRARDNAA